MKSYSAYNLDSQEFSKYERITGLFVVLAVIGFIVLTSIVIINKGWFAKKVNFSTTLTSAAGIYNGTSVNAAGVRIGWVEEVMVLGADNVKVSFNILKKYQNLLCQGSKIAISRQFVVGEKNLELLMAKDECRQLAEWAHLPSVQGVDLIDLVSSPTLGVFLYESSHKISQIIDHFNRDLNRARQIFAELKTEGVNVFDNIDTQHELQQLLRLKELALPMMKNLNTMGRELTKLADSLNRQQRLVKFVEDGSDTFTTINHNAPAIIQKTTPLLDEMLVASQNLNKLSQDMESLLPQIKASSPDLLYLSQRSKLAIDEAITLMQAMQQSFLLKKHADKIKAQQPKPQP